MSGGWFSRLDIVHQAPRRVRLRYACAPATPREADCIVGAAESLQGVRRARVNPIICCLVIEFEPPQTAEQLLVLLLNMTPLEEALARLSRQAEKSIRLAPLMFSAATLLTTPWLGAGVKVLVSIAASVPLLREAINDISDKGITSHVLEALAVAISIGRSDFIAANSTLFLLSLGDYIEQTIERRSDDLLKNLLHPTQTGIWIEKNGEEILIQADEVKQGDAVISGTGTVIPIDGTILSGEALVNEATMTGESLSVMRKRGDRVLAGTRVEEGRLRIYAEQIGRNAAAARITEIVELSLAVKSRTQLDASQLADRLVPLVLSLAGGAWLITNDWTRTAAVLQADYSCALKLATPVAFKVSMHRAGQSGMMVKGAAALEKLAKVDIAYVT